MLQEIDDLLSGGLTDEDEEAVLAELDAITKGDETVELPSVPDEELPEIGKVTHNKKAKVGKTALTPFCCHTSGSAELVIQRRLWYTSFDDKSIWIHVRVS